MGPLFKANLFVYFLTCTNYKSMNWEVSWQPPLSIIVHQTSLKLFLFLLNDFINYFSSLKKKKKKNSMTSVASFTLN